jgi:hypothetical protein
MTGPTYSLFIRIGPVVRLGWNPVFDTWYMSDDGLNWRALPHKIRNAQTAINYAARYYEVTL